MARKRKEQDEFRNKTYNGGGIGYSQDALDALMRGNYREFSGNRQAQYRTSQEQTQQAKSLPKLNGISIPSSDAWESNFSKNKSNIDTDRARAKYEQKIGHTPIGKALTEKDAAILYNGALRMLNNNMSAREAAEDMRAGRTNGTGGMMQGYIKNKNWEHEYGKSLEDLIDEYSKNEGAIQRHTDEVARSGGDASKTLGSVYMNAYVKPVLGAKAAINNLIDPDSDKAKNANKIARVYSDLSNTAREDVTKDMSGVGKTFYDVGTSVADRVLPFLLPGGKAIGSAGTLFRTAEDKRESLEDRGITGRGAIGQSLASGGIDAALDVVGLEKIKGLSALKESGNLAKAALGSAAIGGGEQAITSVINESIDRIFNGEDSVYSVNRQNYINQGMGEDEAQKQALLDEAVNLAKETGQGALFGSVMGVLGNVPGLFKRSDTTRVDVPETEITQPDVANGEKVEGVIPNRTMNESRAQSPRLVKKLEGEELNRANEKVTRNNAQIKALENEIKIIENDPKNQYRGNLKKSAKADIEQRKAQIKELKQDNKVTNRQINGEPTPIIEQLDERSASSINDFKKEVRKIGSMWGGEGGKQLAKDVNDALDRYIETGSREDLADFREKLYTLHDSATGEYTSKNGNVSRYSDYYGDREFGIYEDLASGNSLLNKALREVDNLRNAGQTTPEMEITNDVPPIPPENGGNVPPEGDRVRSFSMRGSNDETLPDETRNTLSEDYYKIVRNQDVEARADSLFVPENLTQTRSNLDRAVEDHDPAAALLSYRLAKAYVDNGDYDAATDVLQNVSAELTRMGQFTQAAKLAMLQNDPMAAMRSYMRDLEKLNQWGRDKYKGKWNNLELSEEDIATISNIQKGDSEALNSAIDALNEKFSKQIPSNWWDKTVSATKTAMLLNPRTQFRNVLANMATLPLRSASDRVAAVGQNIAHLINDDVKVTQSVLGGTKEQKNIAAQVFDRLKDEITGENKMKDSVKSDILSQRQIFNDDFLGKWVDNLTNGGIQRLNEKFGANGNQSTMETLQNLTYWLMGDVGDTPFVKKNFVNRLASYMKAQGINNIDDIPDEAISIATQEALKATFKDDNRFTKALQGVKQKSGKFGEVALPFVKTPANLTMRAVDYSPAGIINTFRKIKSGAEANAVIDDLSKNLTGTALIYLGYKLAEKGLLSGSYSQDPDEAAFQKQQGMLENAIHIGDNYYTYDWTQPASTPLLLGQTIYEGVKASDQENASIKDIVNATYKGGLRVANTVINSSPLQSLADLLGDSPYSDEGIAENIMNEILEFPQRFIPSVVGATARTIDPVMRDTYIKDTTLTGALGNQARQAMAKIPFLSRTLPASYDTWGNERTRSDSAGEAFFAQMVNPGQLGNKNATPLDDEIQRLFESTGDNAVFPLYAVRSLNLGSDGNIALTNKQHSEYQRKMGQRSYSYAESLMNNEDFKKLADGDKVNLLAKAYKLSNELTKEEMFNHVTDSDKNLKEVARNGKADDVAKYLLDNAKAKSLGMSMAQYQKAESNGGAEKLVAEKQAAQDLGFVNKDGNVNLDQYQKVIQKAGAQSEKLINDIPSLQQMGLEKSAYYAYANAINVVPSITPTEFAQTYNEINTSKEDKLTQKEMLAYINKYQFSENPDEDAQIVSELWKTYQDGTWKKVPYLKKDGTWGLH